MYVSHVCNNFLHAFTVRKLCHVWNGFLKSTLGIFKRSFKTEAGALKIHLIVRGTLRKRIKQLHVIKSLKVPYREKRVTGKITQVIYQKKAQFQTRISRAAGNRFERIKERFKGPRKTRYRYTNLQ